MESIHILETLAFVGVLLTQLIAIELLQRYVFVRVQWSRIASHILSGLVLVFMPFYLGQIDIILIAVGFTIIMYLSKRLKVLTLHSVERKTYGEILYPVTMIILALVTIPSHPIAFQGACLVLAIPDACASIVGQRFPIKTIYLQGNAKSVGGSLTYALCITSILFCFPTLSVEHATCKLGFALLATVVEALLIYGVDNLIVPVLTGLFYMYFM